jgi:nucleotide-binding universal stress UspA family protein
MMLLVPVDGSAASDHAVRHALWLAGGRADAAIALLNVQNRDTLGLSDIHAEDEDERQAAAAQSARTLHRGISACQEAGIPFTVHMESARSATSSSAPHATSMPIRSSWARAGEDGCAA